MSGFAAGIVILLLSTHFIYRLTRNRRAASVGSLTLSAATIGIVDGTGMAIAEFSGVVLVILLLRLSQRLTRE